MVIWGLSKVEADLIEGGIHRGGESASLAKWIWEEGMCFSASHRGALSEEEEEKIVSMIDRVVRGEPVQYIVGHAWFYGKKFIIDNSVLIPRPETEELADWIIKDFDKVNTNIRILDIGTGSGCIAITLKSVLKDLATVIGIDISPHALEVARQNAVLHGTDVEFIEHDFLHSGLNAFGKFDIIVSNPPYIFKETMTEKVLEGIKFEPEIALFPPGGDPDIFYKKISSSGRDILKQRGACYLELNEFRWLSIRSYFQNEEWNEVSTRRDMQGRMRLLKAIK